MTFGFFFGLQLPLQEVSHLRVEVPGGVPSRNPMVPVGVVEGFKLLVGRNERIDEVHSILEVDVVITGSMDQQEIAFQLVDMRDGRVVIVASWIQLGRLQVPLGVNGIVVPPGRHRGYCDRSLKDVVADHQGKGRHVSPVGPAPNSNSR